MVSPELAELRLATPHSSLASRCCRGRGEALRVILWYHYAVLIRMRDRNLSLVAP
jgi:hypothetical protein